MSGMREQHAILGKFKFLQILLDYEHAVPLNMPVAEEGLISLDLSQLLDNHWQRHFLAGLLLKQIDASKDQLPVLRTQVTRLEILHKGIN